MTMTGKSDGYIYLGTEPIICGSSVKVSTSGVQSDSPGSTPGSRTTFFTDTIRAIGYGLLIGSGLGAILIWLWSKE